MVYIIDKTNRSSRAWNSRREDYAHMEKEARTNPDPNARKKARAAMSSMRKEQHDGAKRSMRQSLINAHRAGKTEEVKDIHEYIKNKKKYKNE